MLNPKIHIMKFCILLILIFSLLGCQTVNDFVLREEERVEHPDSVKSYYMDDPNWWCYKKFEVIRNSISEYLVTHPNVSSEISTALNKIRIQKGMTKEEVGLLLGRPNSFQQVNGTELLVYDKLKGIYAEVPWDIKTFHLEFKNGRLVVIEIKRIIVHH